MPPKKKEVQKLSLGDFMKNDAFGGSWADEVEETYESGTQPLPPSDRPRMGGASFGGGGGNDRGYSYRERDVGPARLPDKPPYLAHLGNLNYDVTNDDIQGLLAECGLITVRLIEDRETQRPKGFGYAEFETLDGLKQALSMDGTSFQNRSIKIRIADPPKDRDRGESTRDLGDWTRRGPLPDLPRGGGAGGDRRTGPSDFGERRAPRENQGEERRDITWERKGPLSPLPQAEAPLMSRTGSRPRNNEGRSESMRGDRRASPAAWGEGRQDGSRPPRRDFSDRPDRPERPERSERAPTAAEKDMQWRSNMRPDAPTKSPAQSRSGSEAPPSPAPAAAAVPASRPKLNLAKRTVSEAPDVTSPALTSAGGDSKASPFGAARPINTAAREREVEEKRQIAIKEKKEAEEKAKEERRLAKEEAAAKAAEKADAEQQEDKAEDEKSQEPSKEDEGSQAADSTGNTSEQKAPVRPGEPRENIQNAKSRANDSGNWRQPSGDQRESRGSRGPVPSGPRRGGGGPPRGPRHDGPRPPRANGSGGPPVQQSQTPQQGAEDSEPIGPDEDGWEKVPNKGRRSQRARPVAS